MKDLSENTDEELVALSLEHTQAFAVLVGRYEKTLIRYIWRLGVTQAQDEEDILQDAFLKIYRNLRKFDTSLKFSSWAYRIVHNETMNFLSKRKRRPQGNYSHDNELTLGKLAHKDELIDDIHVKLEYEKALEGIQELKPKYRDILLLRFVEGMEYKEISDILRLPMGSVATNLYRAKKALQKVL